MKVLVGYMSSSGNTKKVAEAIYSELECEKEIKDLRREPNIEGYDLAFLGFPVHGYGPDKRARTFLENNTKGKNIALFMTHASPEDWDELPEWLDKFNAAASEANIVGRFDCQGQLQKGVKFIMSIIPGKPRAQAKIDNSQGQPDASRLQRAGVFARNVMNQVTRENEIGITTKHTPIRVRKEVYA
jgi:flavodoxin